MASGGAWGVATIRRAELMERARPRWRPPTTWRSDILSKRPALSSSRRMAVDRVCYW